VIVENGGLRNFSMSKVCTGASILMGQGGHVPPIFIKRGHLWQCPPNILEVMSFRMSTRVTATVVCCILMQLLCVVSQKNFSFWWTSSPRPPTGALPLDPAGGLPSPRTQVFFYVSPNNPVRLTPLGMYTAKVVICLETVC